MIRRTIDLANQPPLDGDVIKDRALAWCDALFPTVPEGYLEQSLDRAIDKHQTTFPVSVHEILLAWKGLWAEIMSARERQEYEDRAKAERVSPDIRVCLQCFGSGFRHMNIDNVWGKEYPGVCRCYDCDYWQRRKEIKSKEGHYKS
jgi:hypothetical protein